MRSDPLGIASSVRVFFAPIEHEQMNGKDQGSRRFSSFRARLMTGSGASPGMTVNSAFTKL
jgi:hypothetical protein